jgi:hypothetical protein
VDPRERQHFTPAPLAASDRLANLRPPDLADISRTLI